MEGYITYNQLGMLIMFLLLCVAGGYAIITMRNVNVAVKNIGAILRENQQALGQAIPNIAIASENAAAITQDLRAGFSETSKAMETADQIASYALVIGETAKAIANIFSSSKKG
ncbi:MAG: hypothetical protein OEL83_09715 [Desulforhopalus sp.]|nr:hypothetical protein [Desulforhopalus sp.]